MTVYFFITVAVMINIVRARLRGVSDGIGLCKKLLHGISPFLRPQQRTSVSWLLWIFALHKPYHSALKYKIKCKKMHINVIALNLTTTKWSREV